MRFSSFLLLTALTTSFALNFTNPKAGTTILAQYDYHITWTTTSSDAKLVNFVLTNSNSTGLDQQTLASNISTAALHYTVPASTFAKLTSFGSDFQIFANSIGSEGNALVGESGDFTISNATAGPSSSESATASAASATATTSSGAAASFHKAGSGKGMLGLMAAGVLVLIIEDGHFGS